MINVIPDEILCEIIYHVGDMFTDLYKVSKRFVRYAGYALRSNACTVLTDRNIGYYPNVESINCILSKYREPITSYIVKQCRRLKSLSTDNNPYMTNDTLAGATELQWLSIVENTLITDDGLAHCPNLATLSVNASNAISPNVLKHLPQLTELKVYRLLLNFEYGTKLTRLTITSEYFDDAAISSLSSLTYLSMSETRVTDDGLKRCTLLRELLMFSCKVSVDGVACCQRITHLKLHDNYLWRNTDLERFTVLKKLDLYNTSITTVRHVCAGLEHLCISYTDIDGSCLHKFANLESLEILGCSNVTYNNLLWVRPDVNVYMRIGGSRSSETVRWILWYCKMEGITDLSMVAGSFDEDSYSDDDNTGYRYFAPAWNSMQSVCNVAQTSIIRINEKEICAATYERKKLVRGTRRSPFRSNKRRKMKNGTK